MSGTINPQGEPDRSEGEMPFVPRIINPIKVRQVVLFAADEAVRASREIIRAEMPWADVQVFSNPLTVSDIRYDGAMVIILDDMALNLVDTDRIRRNNPNAVIVLLSFHRLVQCSPPSVALKEYPYTARADLIFAANRGEFAPEKIITSVVRAAEDHLNIEKCSENRRFILLIVDDEPSWPSQFLPILYGIIGQRADVKITRTYEETLQFMFGVEDESLIREDYREHGNGDQVVCLITDVFFPKEGRIDSEAGRSLIRLTNKYYVRIPIIIASKAAEAAEFAASGFVLPKGDPGSLETLRTYIRDLTGIGDFVIQDEEGKELYRLKDIRDMYRLLLRAGGEDLEAEQLRSVLGMYGEWDMFSTWFYMHSLRELGDKLRPRRYKGKQLITELEESLKREFQRMRHIPLMIGGNKIFDLDGLLKTLQSATPETIAPFSDNDIISSWLDSRGYSELAEELRPIHGKGAQLQEMVTSVVEEWIKTYGNRGEHFPGLPEPGN
jgi:hypothetical protein